ncbi:LOW QUALITY PROTEIN: glycine cleavage system T protein [Aspergillus luchuensis]|uniref:Glycine cleavage system T protein n=1 Tax=Aspergillus kawachii TaxID=1069201 RepID=A0A146FIS9_ASPKA|nr:LOW QUALITY PROTEIN: glycine cleavage system T protein [Aspergillus luchuensis]
MKRNNVKRRWLQKPRPNRWNQMRHRLCSRPDKVTYASPATPAGPTHNLALYDVWPMERRDLCPRGGLIHSLDLATIITLNNTVVNRSLPSEQEISLSGAGAFNGGVLSDLSHSA